MTVHEWCDECHVSQNCEDCGLHVPWSADAFMEHYADACDVAARVLYDIPASDPMRHTGAVPRAIANLTTDVLTATYLHLHARILAVLAEYEPPGFNPNMDMNATAHTIARNLLASLVGRRG